MQIPIHRPERVEHFVAGVDEHRRRRKGVDHQPFREYRQGARQLRPLGRRARGEAHHVALAAWKAAQRLAAAAEPEQVRRLGLDGELAFAAAERFGVAEQQQAARPQREAEHGQHLLLRVRLQVDHQVAAGDEIDVGEWGISEEVVFGEHHGVPHLRGDAVALVLRREEAVEPRPADRVGDVGGIQTVARHRERPRIDVGSKHLRPCRAIEGRQCLGEQHDKRVGFLAGAASSHPDADRLACRMAGDQHRKYLGGEMVEHLGVAEELRDVNQKVVDEEIDLGRIAGEKVEIVVNGSRDRSQHADAALNAAGEGARLVG